jgi:hypothetical protein
MFNPRPRIQSLPITAHHACHVVDDALLDPDALVEFAVRERARFAKAPHNAYPGIELRMQETFSTRLDDFFRLHLRARLGARRTLRMYSRLSLVTLPPSALEPRQCICHRDRMMVEPDQMSLASVLYLFRDTALGGTSFYVPRRGARETDELLLDSGRLSMAEFTRRYGVPQAYLSDSNDWFERVLQVPARWNRMIFYDGGMFHSGDIIAPERLSDDPREGRLSLNGFFTCSRALL